MISLLSIARFKAIRQAELHLRKLNLFAGINGMGKSTRLQALLLLRQSWIARTLPAGLLLRGGLVDLGQAEDVLHQFEEEESIEFKIETDDGLASWCFAVGGGSKLDHEILKLHTFTDTYGDSTETLSGAYRRSPFTAGFRYLSAERVRPEVAYETSFYSVRELDQIGTRGEFAVHYLAEHQSRELPIAALRHATMGSEQTDLLSNVRAWMGEVSPGISLEVQQYPAIQKASVSYQYDTGPGKRFSHSLRPTNVGFGITYALPIVISVLSARPGDTLLIENPESHLHPSGQSKLGRMMAIAAASGVQVVAETHSDHVFNGIRLAVKCGDISSEDVAIFSFDRPRGDPSHDVRIVTPRIDKDGKVDQWPTSFFDETEKLLFDLL